MNENYKLCFSWFICCSNVNILVLISMLWNWKMLTLEEGYAGIRFIVVKNGKVKGF